MELSYPRSWAASYRSPIGLYLQVCVTNRTQTKPPKRHQLHAATVTNRTWITLLRNSP